MFLSIFSDIDMEGYIPASPPIFDTVSTPNNNNTPSVVQSTYFSTASSISPAKLSQAASSQIAPSISTLRYDNDPEFENNNNHSQMPIPNISQDHTPLARALFDDPPSTMEYCSQSYTQIMGGNNNLRDISTMCYTTPDVQKPAMCSLFCKRCKSDVAITIRKDQTEK
jgi:hypothetical protein